MNRTAKSRYPVRYEQRADKWVATCPSLKVRVTGPSLAQARSRFLAAAQQAVSGGSVLPPSRVPNAVSKVYSEVIDVHAWTGTHRGASLHDGMLPEHGPYEDADGAPLVFRSIVMVLDRLGTSNVMAKGLTSDDLLAERALMTCTLDWLGDEQTTDFQTLATYTDNLVHAVPVDPQDPAMQLGFSMIAAAHYQLALAVEDRLMRGGIVIGDHHTSQGLIAGPALIEAHRLEADVAVHPRILLSSTASWLALNTVIHDESRPAESAMGVLLRIDGDGQAFLNYLAMIGEHGDRRSQNTILRRHRDAIRRNLTKYESEPRPLSKWRWTAQYHNYFVADAERAPSLRVPDHEIGLDEWAFGRSFRSVFDDQDVVAALTELIDSMRRSRRRTAGKVAPRKRARAQS